MLELLVSLCLHLSRQSLNVNQLSRALLSVPFVHWSGASAQGEEAKYESDQNRDDTQFNKQHKS